MVSFSNRLSFLAGTLVACMVLPAAADVWEFSVPPSGTKVVEENRNWRAHSAVEITLQHVGPVKPETLYCSFFFQTKNDLWFESRKGIFLTGARQTLRLRLDSMSPDWQCRNARRAFAPDVLRWVRSWGIKVFSRSKVSGKIESGELRLLKEKGEPLEVFGVSVPRRPVAGRTNPVRFRLGGFRGNFFRSADISGFVSCTGAGAETKVPVYFRQDYVRTTHPGTKETMIEPVETPVWQADWRPERPGTFDLELHLTTIDGDISRRLGRFNVAAETAPPAAGVRPAAVTEEDYLVKVRDDGTYAYKSNRWKYPESGQGAGEHWRVHLDWTSKWGHYTGLGEFDQLLAWKLEKYIESRSNEKPRPILVFTQDVLDDQGTYNWVDHPLNAANGGSLERASDIFLSDAAAEIVMDRARYLWARYGRFESVSGLLLLIDRAEPEVVKWVGRIASTLADTFPDAQVLCNSRGLPERWVSTPLKLFDKWEKDRRLSINTHLKVDEQGKELDLIASYTHTAAVVSRRTHHWAGASAFACDVQSGVGPDGESKVMLFFRTDPGTVWQSKLVPLRKDSWDRVVFYFDDPDWWTCCQDKERRLTQRDLMTVRELGLRFFCRPRIRIPVRVKNCTLLGPYTIDHEKTLPFAIKGLRGNEGRVVQHEKFELIFFLNRVFNNPYDSEEIDVSIELTDPKGRRLRHPGYYHETWDLRMIDGRETPVKTGSPTWRVRVTPWIPGRYEWRLTAVTGDEKAEMSGSFDCTPGNPRGFLRLSERDPRYMEFSNGEFYYPIGHNLRSPSDRRPGIYGSEVLANVEWSERQGTRAYEKWFRKMRDHDENFSRIWMSPWWCGLEWNRDHEGYHGIGYYNQANAARLDRILELAEKEGIYLNVETANHGTLSTFIDKQWRYNPLNQTMPDGYLRYATDFFTSRRAMRSHRDKLRYTVARWGYSTAIAWWGVMTEAEWVEPYFRGLHFADPRKIEVASWVPRPYKTRAHQSKLISWLVETDRYIREMDAHPHLVSSHFSNPPNGKELWHRPGGDIVHNNAYTSFTGYWRKERFQRSKGCADVIYVFCDVYQPYCRTKPLLIGEWAGDPHKNTEAHLTAELHTGIWAIAMTRTGGVTGYWWWNLLDTRNLYPHFKAVAAFMKGEDRRGKDYRSERALLQFVGKGVRNDMGERDGLVLYNKNELFAYIYSRGINRKDNSTVPRGFEDPSFPESGPGKLIAPEDLADGKYTLQYWNTFTGKPIRTDTVTIGGRDRSIPIMSHHVDLALKVKREHRTRGRENNIR